MKIKEKDMELCHLPYGIPFKDDERTYIAVGFTNTQTLCYDVTDLEEIQISSYSTVKVDKLMYESIKRYMSQHGHRHFADFQRDNEDVQLERQLDLRMGELKKKKNSPEVKALRKIIETFPFILDVAENNYKQEYADMALIKHMFEKCSVEDLVQIYGTEKESDEHSEDDDKSNQNCKDEWHLKDGGECDTCPSCGMNFL